MKVLVLKPVQTPLDWEVFIDLPWSLYQDEPHWVPPLKKVVRDTLNLNKNPFYKHAVIHPFLVYQDEKCVGRIVGIIDENYNCYHEEKNAFFGFFEAINSQPVADILLNQVASWAKSMGMHVLRGPVNPSMNQECGVLVQGFEDPPLVMMPYNPPYYAKLLENWGFVKAKDLLAYSVNDKKKISSRILLQAQRLKKSNSIHFRTIKMNQFNEEVQRIFSIYNDAWEKNWGFVPFDVEEIWYLAKQLKTIIDPKLVLMAEIRGEAVGFALALPDINQVIKKIKNGRLFPFRFFQFIWDLKGPGRRKTINRCRILTLGTKKAYQHLGIGALFYAEYFKRGPALGYSVGEASWVLEDNQKMNKALKLMCGEKTKVYRIYEKHVTQ